MNTPIRQGTAAKQGKTGFKTQNRQTALKWPKIPLTFEKVGQPLQICPYFQT